MCICLGIHIHISNLNTSLFPHQVKTMLTELAELPFTEIPIVPISIRNKPAAVMRRCPTVGNPEFVGNTEEIITITTTNHSILNMSKATVVVLFPAFCTTVLEVPNCLPVTFRHRCSVLST